MKLTMAQKKGIKTWLEMSEGEKNVYCPFDFDDSSCEDICAVLFPRIKPLIEIHRNWCPCFNYTLAHVIRVARKAVEK